MENNMAEDTNESNHDAWHYFVTYTGVKLPLRLITPLDPADVKNRNTYMRAYFDAGERMTVCQKIVYGEIELEHRYRYHDNGAVMQVEISFAGEESGSMRFDRDGKPQL